jgi:hypothetical protein
MNANKNVIAYEGEVGGASISASSAHLVWA